MIKLYSVWDDLKNKTFSLSHPLITAEMKEHHFNRTKKHIKLVWKYQEMLTGSVIEPEHDFNKFSDKIITGYILINWAYKAEKSLFNDELVKKMMQEATIYHITNSYHHPEFHCKNLPEDIINPNSRDAIPSEPIDAKDMPLKAIDAMCSDWCAVSEERNTNPMDWYNMNNGKRWLFSENQQDRIVKNLNKVWK